MTDVSDLGSANQRIEITGPQKVNGVSAGPLPDELFPNGVVGGFVNYESIRRFRRSLHTDEGGDCLA